MPFCVHANVRTLVCWLFQQADCAFHVEHTDLVILHIELVLLT